VKSRMSDDDLRARVAKLEAAHKKIANRSPWTNFDGQPRKDYPKGDDGLADYWCDVANGCREISLAALKDNGDGK
jgi:hypothetical protein